jgi:hypothetical protein
MQAFGPIAVFAFHCTNGQEFAAVKFMQALTEKATCPSPPWGLSRLIEALE